MVPKNKKDPKKLIDKKKILPKFPKGTNVKVYEINFRTVALPLIIGVSFFILFYGVRNYITGEKIVYDDAI